MAERPPTLATEAALRQKLKAPGEVLLRKIRPELDQVSRIWIDHAAMVGLCRRRSDGLIDVSARASSAGFISTKDNHTAQIVTSVDNQVGFSPTDIKLSRDTGSIYMMPGINETLRANGKLVGASDQLELQVNECYVHCPKAYIRGGLWKPERANQAALSNLSEQHGDRLTADSCTFLDHAPFMLMGTALEAGGADLSPRGDPAGFLQIINDRSLIIPDRPGNHIADSFRNIIANPVVGLLIFIPGINWTLNITGEAHIIDDVELLSPMTERGRTPTLGIWVDIAEAHLTPAPALATAGIWDTSTYRDKKSLPTVGQALAKQMEPKSRFNKIRGWVIDRLLDRDAKKNLY